MFDIILLVIAAFLAAGGQIFLKLSTQYSTVPREEIINYFLSLLINPFAWIAIFCYGLSFALYMFILKNEGLAYARSFSALSYVLVITSSLIFFREPFNLIKILGVVLIAAGILLVGISNK